jgi:hypothetical protein
MKIYKLLIVAVCALAFLSCKKYADPSSEDLGYSFFPINDGDYSIYSVIDTSYNGSGVIDTIKQYFIKEEIHHPITVNDEVRYQVYVYYKNAKTDTWKSYPDSVWTEFNSLGKIIRVENNVRFVKLVFPLEVGKSWDGNISDPSNDPQDYYEMKNIRRSYSYGNYYYPNTVSVVQIDDISVIRERYSIEVYADETGLVYKEVKDYDYQLPPPGGGISFNIQGGHRYIQKLIKHGRYK